MDEKIANMDETKADAAAKDEGAAEVTADATEMTSDAAAKEALAEDLEPSTPRTPTQAVLRMVSILMGFIGALGLVGGLIVLITGVLGGEDLWAGVTFGVMVVVAAGLLLLTAVLGLAASNNSARVGPYRFLCYLVGLAVLVAIVWGWGVGSFILFNPIVLTITIVYVLICSRLADKVKEEHDRGVSGESFLRSRHQRVLHLVSELVVLKGVLTVVAIIVIAALLVVYGEGERAMISGVPISVSGELVALLVVGGASAAANIGVGFLGILGSNRPERIGPHLAVSSVLLAVELVRLVADVVARGLMGLSFDHALDVLFLAASVYLAVRIKRQPPIEQVLS